MTTPSPNRPPLRNPRPELRRRLRALKRRGVPATSIAQAAGVSKQAMSATLLSHETIAEKMLRKIAKAIDEAEKTAPPPKFRARSPRPRSW